MNQLRNRSIVAAIGVAFALSWVSDVRTSPGRVQGQAREFTINAGQFAFSPTRIEVQKDDLVKITFNSGDMPHSFTIDNPYRIAKRAGAGQTVVFEFRADQAGAHRFYCSLTQDDRCRKMEGQLIVR